jgi:dTDP-4-amino-4,6-dideoxygalactose transaminase
MELGIDGDLPNTDAAAASSMSLPMYPGLTETEQAQVIEALRASVMHNAATTGERR